MVHTSLMENGLWAVSCVAGALFAEGSDFSNYPPRGFRYFARERYETADGRWFMFSMLRTPEQTFRLFDVLGQAALLSDERFATHRDRIVNSIALTSYLRPVLRQRTAKHWLELFEANEIPVTLVTQVEDLRDEPQLTANQFIKEPDDDIAADYVIDHPINVSSIDSVGIKKAPEIGEHTLDILSELGFSEDDIVAFGDDGAFSQANLKP